MPCFGNHHPWITATRTSSPPTSNADQARPAVAEIVVTAVTMTKNFRTRRHFGVRSSKCPNRMLPRANSVAIAATSIHRFMAGVLGSESLPQKIGVQYRNHDRDRPGHRLDPERARKRSHLVFVAREHHQREDRKRQLQAENHLAENQQLSGSAFAVEPDDNHRRNDGNEPRDQPPQP